MVIIEDFEDEKVIRKCEGCGLDLKPPFKWCSVCKSVVYCSRGCQMNHWPTHKITHGKPRPKSPPKMPKNPHCFHCKKKNIPPKELKRCTRCKSVFFCSKECWNYSTHKLGCIFDDNAAPNTKPVNYKKVETIAEQEAKKFPQPDGSYLKPEDAIKSNIDACHRVGNIKQKLVHILELADLYLIQKILPQAIEMYNKALQQSLELNDKKNEGVCYRGLGNVAFLDNKMDKAVEYHRKDLNIAMENKDLSSLASAYGNLAGCFQSQNNFPKAVDYLERTLEIVEKIDDDEKECTTLLNLSNVYANDRAGSKCNPVKAMDIATKAIDIAIKINNQGLESQGYFMLARARQVVGDVHEAKVCYRKSIDLSAPINYRPDIQEQARMMLRQLSG